MNIAPTTDREELRAIRERLHQAFWRLYLQRAALLLLGGILIFAALNAGFRALMPEKSGEGALFLRSLGLLAAWFVFVGVSAVITWRRLQAPEAVARLVEEKFPELGLKITASLEVAQKAGAAGETPESIRARLWKQTREAASAVAWNRLGNQWFSYGVILLALLGSLGFLGTTASQLFGLINFESRAAQEKEEPKNETPPAEILRAELHISDPADDMWATRIEAIPVLGEAKSPHGFESLRIRATINGEKTHEFSLPAEGALAKDTQTFEGEIYMDELDIQDYDVITYAVVGNAVWPGHEPVERVSEAMFIQVRPLDKEIFKAQSGEMPGGLPEEMMQMMNLLTYLIEEQRLNVRGTWTLKQHEPEFGGTDDFKKGVEFVRKSQTQIRDTTEEAYTLFTTELQEMVDAALLVQLEIAREQMDLAIVKLDKSDWDAALPPEQKALAALVNILSNVRQVLMQSSPSKSPSGAQPPQQARGLEDRQTVRPLSQEMQELAEQQSQLTESQGAAESKVNDIPLKEYHKQREQMLSEQEKLAQQARDLADKAAPNSPEQQMMEQAADAMEQNAKSMAMNGQPSPEQGKPGNEPSQSSSSAPGQLAESLTRRAAELARDRERGQLADQLRDTMNRLSAAHSELEGQQSGEREPGERPGREEPRAEQPGAGETAQSQPPAGGRGEEPGQSGRQPGEEPVTTGREPGERQPGVGETAQTPPSSGGPGKPDEEPSQAGREPGEEPGAGQMADAGQPGGAEPGEQPGGLEPGEQPGGAEPGEQPGGAEPGEQEPGRATASAAPSPSGGGREPGEQAGGQRPGDQPGSGAGEQPGIPAFPGTTGERGGALSLATPEGQGELAAVMRDDAGDLKTAVEGSEDEIVKGAVNKAAGALTDASKPFDAAQGTAEDLEPAIAELASAYRQTIGQQAHLAQLGEELSDLERQLRGLQRSMEKKPGGESGDQQTPGQGEDEAPGQGEGKAPGQSSAPGKEPGSAPGEGQEPPTGQGKGEGEGEGEGSGPGKSQMASSEPGKGEGKSEGQGQGQGKGKGEGKGQGEGQGQGAEGSGSGPGGGGGGGTELTPRTIQNLQAVAGSMEQRLEALIRELETQLGREPTLGELEDAARKLAQEFPQFRQPRPALKDPPEHREIPDRRPEERRPPNPVDVYQLLNAYIHQVADTRRKLADLMTAEQQRDLLVAMENQQVAPEYKELVHAYFEKLSRQSAEPAPAPKPATTESVPQPK